MTTIFYVFLGSLIIQLLFLIRFFIAFFKVKKKKEITAESRNFPVSVVICGKNEESNLKKLIPALFNQNHNNFEVIVVDDQSNDHAYDYLLEEKNRHDNLKVVKLDEPPGNMNSKKYGLTLGIKAATHDRILLTDADCIPASEDWIASMVQDCRDKEFILGYSPYERRTGLLNAFIRFETLWTAIQYISQAALGRAYMGVGRNLSYRKSFFLDQKGFHGLLKITGGDDDLFVNKYATRKNTCVSVGKESIVWSYPKTTWGSYIKQKNRHLAVGKLYRAGDKLRIGLIALSWIALWVSLVVLIIFKYELYFVVGGYLLRLAFLIVLLHYAGKKLGDKINVLFTPLFDFIGFLYYLLLGTKALFTKKVKWN